ncbi:MAG: helix-turn-helix domain-containing protein [Ferruginibacter sp.]
MKHVSIIIPLGHSSISHIESTYQILSHVNGILADRNKSRLFNIQLVGLSMPASDMGNRFAAKPDVLISDVNETQLIIIPATIGNPNDSIALNQEFIPWIRQQRESGAEVASFCVGAFLLAATGLLKGKRCSTHWFSAAAFRQMFPDANLMDDKIMTEDDGIYTSGGAYSYLNLLLYLVEKFVARDVAIVIAKTYMIDIDRTSQSPFIIFQGQKEHDDEAVKNAQEFIESNFQEKIMVEQLTNMLALSRRSLERRFKQATGNTIIEYLQRVKIEAAKKEFESSRKNISEVMYDVGYTDTKGFRTVFKKVTGISPAEYRSKYNKLIAV